MQNLLAVFEIPRQIQSLLCFRCWIQNLMPRQALHQRRSRQLTQQHWMRTQMVWIRTQILLLVVCQTKPADQMLKFVLPTDQMLMLELQVVQMLMFVLPTVQMLMFELPVVQLLMFELPVVQLLMFELPVVQMLKFVLPAVQILIALSVVRIPMFAYHLPLPLEI
eukprot:Colp12_sorted_trinity150504_noHs@9516